MAEKKGRWVTVMGRRIFIEEGKTLQEAMAQKNASSGQADPGPNPKPSMREPKNRDDAVEQVRTFRDIVNSGLEVKQEDWDYVDWLKKKYNITMAEVKGKK